MGFPGKLSVSGSLFPVLGVSLEVRFFEGSEIQKDEVPSLYLRVRSLNDLCNPLSSFLYPKVDRESTIIRFDFS